MNIPSRQRIINYVLNMVPGTKESSSEIRLHIGTRDLTEGKTGSVLKAIKEVRYVDVDSHGCGKWERV